jgi:hypothetical protein
MTATEALTTLGSLVGPEAKRCIDDAAAGKADVILTTVLGFLDDDAGARALQYFLCYAHARGVEVRFTCRLKE